MFCKIFCSFLIINYSVGKTFRFWNFKQTLGTTTGDLCNVFGQENMQHLDIDIVCDSVSPCSDYTIDGVSCGVNDNSSSSVTSIDFTSRTLTGYLPSTITELDSLVTLKLNQNYYSGTIPTSFGLLSRLELLDLSDNSLVGVVPSAICYLQSLTYLSLGYNKLDCYESCIADMGIDTDFLDSLPVCSSLIDDAFISPYIRQSFSECSYAQNPATSSEWSNRDFCSYYLSTKCPVTRNHHASQVACVDGNPPECLQSAGSAYCQAFSLLSLGCGADTGQNVDTVAAKVDTCISDFYSALPALTLVSIAFSFPLQNILLDVMTANIADESTYTRDRTLIAEALATAAGFPFSGIVINTFEPESSSGEGTAIISGVAHSSAEELGFDSSSVADAAVRINEIIANALATADGGSLFMIQLKSLASSIVALQMAFVQIGSSFVTDTSSNGVASFQAPSIQFLKTSTPTTSPTSTFEPTLEPTLSPTPAPSISLAPVAPSLRSVAPSASFRPTPTAAPTDITRCLDVEVADLFGDGWDNAHLMIYTSYAGRTTALAPLCTQNPLMTQHCFSVTGNNDGDYVVMTVTGFAPDRPWEIFWRVQDRQSNISLVGDYSSTFIFTFRERFVPDGSGSGDKFKFKAWIDATNVIGAVTAVGQCRSCDASYSSPVVDATPALKTVSGNSGLPSSPRSPLNSVAVGTIPRKSADKARPTDRKTDRGDVHGTDPIGPVPRDKQHKNKIDRAAEKGSNTGDVLPASSAGTTISYDKPDKVDTPDKKPDKVDTPDKKPEKVDTPDKKPEKVDTPDKKPEKVDTPDKKPEKVVRTDSLHQNDHPDRERERNKEPKEGGEEGRRNVGSRGNGRSADVTTGSVDSPDSSANGQTPSSVTISDTSSEGVVSRTNVRTKDLLLRNDLSGDDKLSTRTAFYDVIARSLEEKEVEGSAVRALDSVYGLNYLLYGYDNKWDFDSGLGAKFFVSDADGGLVYSGTLCATSTSKNALCSMSLNDGDYRWRVTGGLTEHAAAVGWTFCGVNGKAAAELMFTVKDGGCLPVRLDYASTASCDDDDDDDDDGTTDNVSLSSSGVSVGVAISGILELEGVLGSDLSSNAHAAIRSAISQEFSDAGVAAEPLGSDDTSLLSTHIVRRSENNANALEGRRMDAGVMQTESGERDVTTAQVSFHVHLAISADQIGALKLYLDRSMASGLFLTRMQWSSRVAGEASLAHVRHAALVDLRLIHQTVENTEISTLASIFISICGVSGLFFGTLLVLSYWRWRSSHVYIPLRTVDLENVISCN